MQGCPKKWIKLNTAKWTVDHGTVDLISSMTDVVGGLRLLFTIQHGVKWNTTLLLTTVLSNIMYNSSLKLAERIAL